MASVFLSEDSQFAERCIIGHLGHTSYRWEVRGLHVITGAVRETEISSYK